ncbi:MAG: family 20 glycosylhydrolase [Verrucomicrobia bacterium]|nr:family 20 glycosylhydrolase [Verrucomicrobiota bacterium]
MIRAFQWDLGRQVERLDWLLAQLPRYAEWGYQELYLHLEDAVEFPSLPGVARHDAYSYKEMTQLVAEATRVGIKVVPIVNLLGHTQYLIKVPELNELNELRGPDGSAIPAGQICPLHPRTLDIAEKLLRDMAPFCTAGKVHVGLDESFQLGQHPLSKAEIAKIGLAGHFAGHVNRLHKITQKLGLRMGMWADMLYFIPEAIPQLPTDLIIYEWYYYGFPRRPRVELFNFAETDLGEQLRARGFEVWGCPMNGSARYEPLPHFTDRLDNILSWWKRAPKLDIAGLLVTSWEPFRLAMEITTVVDAAAASLWLDGETDPKKMLERGFARVFGAKTAKQAAAVAFACDKYPFSGYPLWQANERWDTVSRREPLGDYRKQVKFFEKLAKQSKALPAQLRTSVDLRHYLAVRDVFLREASRAATTPGVKPGASTPALRKAAKHYAQALKTGQRAVLAMWRFTRDRRVRGANERILAQDAQWFKDWQRGKPVFGARWQLCYAVNNFKPCLNVVAVEQQQADGTWKTIQSCHTIEFQTRAAQPRGMVVREHAAPVEWDGDVSHPPVLRLNLRGVGEVRIENIELTDGRKTPLRGQAKKTLGLKAPTAGLPALDWTTNLDAWPVTWKAGR